MKFSSKVPGDGGLRHHGVDAGAGLDQAVKAVHQTAAAGGVPLAFGGETR